MLGTLLTTAAAPPAAWSKMVFSATSKVPKPTTTTCTFARPGASLSQRKVRWAKWIFTPKRPNRAGHRTGTCSPWVTELVATSATRTLVPSANSAAFQNQPAT